MSDLPPEASGGPSIGGQTTQEDLRALASRLIEEGKDWAAAEINVVTATFDTWSKPVKIAVPLAVVAILLVLAAVTVFVAAFGMALAYWLGVAAGLAAAAFITLLAAAALMLIAVEKLKRLDR
ncbi:hypothetical protein HL653_10705 [Sphingomonas sp. AP4-R1]|uniref:hypothetical protein n=1 Tax=Sphingomonas sp. AP4-R1 TaxID=2735134 RepID=UPI0014939665|nr:hypothetical protein [Sphingomonas sp. AP4-R1]QJU58200.1 hypothetical protein HL653_10705 [Sphingomonas sp. AP4-R1]